MTLLSYIIWSVNPNMIPGWDIPRWYGFLFALGFILSQQVMFFIFKKDGRDEKEVEKLTMYMVVGVVLGARLGHCLFYNPIHYLTHPWEIFMIWEGGLASHGGAIGILIVLWLFARKMKGMTYIWILDRIAIVVCLVGACIRTGNFMNSEIIGTKTDAFTGIVFAHEIKRGLLFNYNQIEDIEFISNKNVTASVEGLEPITGVIEFKEKTGDGGLNINQVQSIFQRYYSDHASVPEGGLSYRTYQSKGTSYGELDFMGIARHPAQLYEAFYCVLLFSLLFHIWYWHRHKLPDGFIFGLLMTLLWTLRFIDEFFKENQEAWEEGLILNMGQILSIPMVLLGIIILIRVSKKKKSTGS